MAQKWSFVVAYLAKVPDATVATGSRREAARRVPSATNKLIPWLIVKMCLIQCLFDYSMRKYWDFKRGFLRGSWVCDWCISALTYNYGDYLNSGDKIRFLAKIILGNLISTGVEVKYWAGTWQVSQQFALFDELVGKIEVLANRSTA